MSVMEKLLKLQSERVVNEVLEHAQNRISMEARDGDGLMKIRSRKTSKKLVSDLYDKSWSDEARSVRRDKCDNKGKK